MEQQDKQDDRSNNSYVGQVKYQPYDAQSAYYYARDQAGDVSEGGGQYVTSHAIGFLS